jgi:DNA invertase Pin-like site-specific DNA recombinase
MLIGYMRVSTSKQSLNLQRDALERIGCERMYDDICSGRAIERPGLSKALDEARRGDTLVVWKLDRIGRSLPHVVGLVGDLQKRGIGLKVLTGDVDTTTATGRLASSQRWQNSSATSFTSARCRNWLRPGLVAVPVAVPVS